MGAPDLLYIPVYTNFVRSPKTLKLARLLSTDDNTAIAYMVKIWLWSMEEKTDGVIKGETPLDAADNLATITGYTGNPKGLLDALIASKYVDDNGDHVSLHDWDSYGGKVKLTLDQRGEKKREQARERMRKYRERDAKQRNASVTERNASVTERNEQEPVTHSDAEQRNDSVTDSVTERHMLRSYAHLDLDLEQEKEKEEPVTHVTQNSVTQSSSAHARGARAQQGGLRERAATRGERTTVPLDLVSQLTEERIEWAILNNTWSKDHPFKPGSHLWLAKEDVKYATRKFVEYYQDKKTFVLDLSGWWREWERWMIREKPPIADKYVKEAEWNVPRTPIGHRWPMPTF